MENRNAPRNSDGFTLIELLVAVAIIGLLAAIALPEFRSYRRKAVDAATFSDARNAATLATSVVDEATADYLCGNTAQCQLYAPMLQTSRSTSAVCWEIENGEFARMCACSKEGDVRAYCVDFTDGETLHATTSCPCPAE